MEERNYEKNQKCLVLGDKWFFFYLFTFDSRADIMTKYTFNQVRCFFTFSVDFMVIKWDTPVKCMNNKFPVLANIYNIYIIYYWYWIFHRIYFFGKSDFACLCHPS